MEGGGGISAANSLRICLVTSSSNISFASLMIFFPAFTNEELFPSLSLDFYLEFPLAEGFFYHDSGIL